MTSTTLLAHTRFSITVLHNCQDILLMYPFEFRYNHRKTSLMLNRNILELNSSPENVRRQEQETINIFRAVWQVECSAMMHKNMIPPHDNAPETAKS